MSHSIGQLFHLFCDVPFSRSCFGDVTSLITYTLKRRSSLNAAKMNTDTHLPISILSAHTCSCAGSTHPARPCLSCLALMSLWETHIHHHQFLLQLNAKHRGNSVCSWISTFRQSTDPTLIKHSSILLITLLVCLKLQVVRLEANSSGSVALRKQDQALT